MSQVGWNMKFRQRCRHGFASGPGRLDLQDVIEYMGHSLEQRRGDLLLHCRRVEDGAGQRRDPEDFDAVLLGNLLHIEGDFIAALTKHEGGLGLAGSYLSATA